jgi:hypothetical protein
MIWSDPDSARDSREVLCRHLVTEIVAAYGDFTPEHAREVAEAVAAYCAERKGDLSLSSEYIMFLISRALRVVGEEQSAPAFSAGRNSPAVEAAAQFRNVPPALWSAFSARLIRPSRWLVDNDREIWVLDLSRFRFDADLCLELAFHQAIYAILRAVAEIWDDSSGAGILGLRHVRSCGRSLREVRSLCLDVFEKIRTRRGWVSVPRVLSLDVAG